MKDLERYVNANILSGTRTVRIVKTVHSLEVFVVAEHLLAVEYVVLLDVPSQDNENIA
jgi:hypothetical protein